MNPAPELQSEQEFSQRFAHVIRGVIDFAGMIPGFQLLTQDDKFTLLKAGLFDALFVRLICMFDTSINSIICLNGQVMRRNSIQNGANARFLVDSTFNFAERMNAMNLSDSEIGLFCAIVLITPDRPGLRNIELVEKMYSRLKGCLQTVIIQNRPDDPDFMMELLKLLPDLRTLSTLHTEKLVVFRTEHKEMLRQQMWSLEEETSKSSGLGSWQCNDQVMEEVTKSPMGSVSSTESGDTASDYSQSLSQSAPLLAATLAGGCPMRMRANSGSSAEDDMVGTAHLTQNGLTITLVEGNRTAEEAAFARGRKPADSGNFAANARSTAVHHIRYRKLDSPTDSGIESGNEKADHKAANSESSSCSSPRSSVDDINEEKRPIAEDMPVLKRVLQAPPLYDTNSLMDEAYKPHKKFRALRHRECEAEADSLQQSSSMQQSQQPQQSTIEKPANSMEHVKASLIKCEKQPAQSVEQHIKSHLTNNCTGDKSAYSYVVQSQQQSQQPQPPHQSQLHMHLTRPLTNTHQHSSSTSSSNSAPNHHQSSLSSTHSVLARSLMEEPRMTPEQIKRSDIIQNYIKRESQVEQQRVSSQGGLLVCALSSASNSSSSNSTSNGSSHLDSMQPTKALLHGQTFGSVSATATSANRWQNGGLSVITTTRQTSPSRSVNGHSISEYNSPSPNMQPEAEIYGKPLRKAIVDGGAFQSPHSTSSTDTEKQRYQQLPDDSDKRYQPLPEDPAYHQLRSTMVSLLQPLNLSKKSPSPVQKQLLQSV